MKPEDSLQITIMDWLRWKYPDVPAIHIPNGGSRNKIEAAKLKRMGVKPGVPDIFIPRVGGKRLIHSEPCFNSKHDLYAWSTVTGAYNGFFCELKAGKNKPTKTQTEMMQKLTELGYYCCVCYSLDEFIKEWEGYVNF